MENIVTMLADHEKESFLAFESVRRSGITNMFDRTRVCAYAGITKDAYMYIVKNYDVLADKYLHAGK